MKSPILKGSRLTLRPINRANAPYFVKCFKDPEVVRFMLPTLYRINLKKEKEYMERVSKAKNEYVFHIYEGKKIIGSCGVHLLAPHSKVAGFGIVICDKDSWGKGYAGECIKILGDFVFKKLKYNRWQLTVDTENKRAIRAYEKAGFKLEGKFREARISRVDGKYHDEFVMSILSKEWLKK